MELAKNNPKLNTKRKYSHLNRKRKRTIDTNSKTYFGVIGNNPKNRTLLDPETIDTNNDYKSLVTNLSSRFLNNLELKLLSFGPKFILSTTKFNAKTLELARDSMTLSVNSYIRSLKLRKIFGSSVNENNAISVPNPSYQPEVVCNDDLEKYL